MSSVLRSWRRSSVCEDTHPPALLQGEQSGTRNQCASNHRGRTARLLPPRKAPSPVVLHRVLILLRDSTVPLWITEGWKKVDSALSNGIGCIVSLTGVENWQSDGMALPDWKEIALRGRRVVIAFASDVMVKASVRSALERFAAWRTAGE